MHPIQISDQSFIAIPPTRISSAISNSSGWNRWFPRLTLVATDLRGDKGVRWVCHGEVDGTAEIWLEPHLDGTLVHFFLHGEPAGKKSSQRLTKTYRSQGRTMVENLRRDLERGRPAGVDPLEWRVDSGSV